MGVHVRDRVLSDTHAVADLEALVGGQSYGEARIMRRLAFKPLLEFPPFGKGQLVQRNLWSHKVAAWTY